MNFFAYKTVAERYAQYRPYFHPLVIEKIKTHLNLSNPVSRSLDIGCGTGQSTIALKEISEFVMGTDVSTEMLKLAKREAGIEYMEASAEDLTIFQSESFDLITSSMAYHWFDYKRFLPETNRLLKNGGWLIIYTNGFHGQMKENELFERWNRQSYAKRFPSPPRNSIPLTSELAQGFGFSSFFSETFQNDVKFTTEELCAYLTTQSNVIAAVEQGNETLEEVYIWLVSQTRPFFHSKEATFLFGGTIWYTQKENL